MRTSICKNLDLARLIFGQGNKKLFGVIEESVKLQIQILDKYLEYIDSGRPYEVSENAWDVCVTRHQSG